MFDFDDASSFVMRGQISRETGRSYQELQYRSDPPLIHFGRSRVNMLRFYHLNRIACHLVRQF
jgi:hypothetical protein